MIEYRREPARNLIEAAMRRREELGEVLKALTIAGESVRSRIDEARGIARPLSYKRQAPLPHAAEDGGNRSVDLEAFTVYAIKAWAGMFAPSRLGGYRLEHEVRAADIGVVLPSGGEETRIRFYREILEAWASRRVLEDAGGGRLLLWDGNITALLFGRRPWSERGRRQSELAREAADAVGVNVDDLLDYVRRAHSMAPLGSQGLVYEYILGRGESRDHLVAGYLEWLEKLEAIRRLFELVIKDKNSIIFITKTTRSRSLLKGAFPDVYYLRAAVPGDPFYTKPRLRLGSIEIEADHREEPCRYNKLFPYDYGDFFQCNFAVLDFYTRLDPGAPILKIERLYTIDEVDKLNMKEWKKKAIEDTLDKLTSLVRRHGYPYSLYLAHEEAHLPGDEVFQAVRALGLAAEKHGREMVE